MRKVKSLLRKPASQIRWQLLLGFALSGLVSVVLLLGFTGIFIQMLVQRAAVNVVERQIELAAHAMLELAGSAGAAAGSSAAPFPAAGRLLEITRVERCRTGQLTRVPDWIAERTFHGVVSESGGLRLRAVVRGEASDCPVDSIVTLPLGPAFAAVLSQAAEMTVEVPGPPGGGRRRTGSGPPGGRRASRPGFGGPAAGGAQTPPDPWWLVLRRLPGVGAQRGDYLPVVVTARDWATGAAVDKVVFRIKPRFDVVFRQISQYGQRQAAWVWLLPILGLLFLSAEGAALFLFLRTTQRIAAAVEALSGGVKRIGAGEFSHRVRVQREDELGVLAEGVNSMALSLERLMEDTRAKARLEEEIRLARDTQLSLYPRELPRLPGAGLAALCDPARMVSGDLYDAMELAPGRIGLLCADVSGKGMAAALLMSNLQAIVRAVLRPAGDLPEPAAFLAQVNADLCGRIPNNRFVTLFWADYDSDLRILRYANAGHCPGLLFAGGSPDPVRLEAGGLPLGLFARASYAQGEARLAPGDILVLYSDGVTEAPGAAGEEFGEERLADVVRRNRAAPAEELAAAIRSAVTEWSSAEIRSDDTTVLVFRAG